MADEGFFSNMKFMDLFLPAAGAVASAYNPHIGRGLYTGMNLFSTFAEFQNNAKRWKQQQVEWEREQEARETGQEAIGTYSRFTQGLLGDKEEEARRAATASWDDSTTLGAEGGAGPTLASTEEPMGPEDMKARFTDIVGQEPGQFGLFGDEGPPMDMEAPQALAPLGGAEIPMPDLHQGLIEAGMESQLAGDPDYQALRERQAAVELLRGTFGAGQGATISSLGNIVQGSTAAAQERARAGEAKKFADEGRLDQFIYKQILADEQAKQAYGLQEKITEEQQARQENWGVIAEGLYKTGDVASMDYETLIREERLMIGEIGKITPFVSEDDPASVKVRDIAMRRLESIRLLIEAEERRQGFIPPGGGELDGDGMGRTETPEQRRAKEALNAQRKLRGLPPIQ